MRALPDDGWSARGDGSGEPPLQGVWESAGLVRHTFTHFALELSVHIQRDAPAAGGSGEWWPLDRLDEAGLPTLFAKAARLALAD
jgi:A/G-specific adenine glycosylase